MIKIVKFWESLPKSKRPSSKSFINTQTATHDILTPAILSFFSYLACLFKPYLLKYQKREPMVPYMHGDLVNLFKSVLKVVIKEETINGCKSSNMLTKIDFEKDTNFKKNKDYNIGFATEQILNELKKKDLVKNADLKEFYCDVRKCVIAAMKKLNEKSPLLSVVVRSAVVFNPESVLENNISTLQQRLKLLLQHFVSVKVISGNNIADKAFEQYALMKDDMEIVDIDLSKLGRLDDFYFKQLKAGKKYPELASVIMVILTKSWSGRC